MVPPRMAQKPIGISRRESGMFVRIAMRPTAGRKSAAAPIFCMKLEIMAMVVEMIAIKRASVLPASRMIGRAI